MSMECPPRNKLHPSLTRYEGGMQVRQDISQLWCNLQALVQKTFLFPRPMKDDGLELVTVLSPLNDPFGKAFAETVKQQEECGCCT
jgi:hypothetical protein